MIYLLIVDTFFTAALFYTNRDIGHFGNADIFPKSFNLVSQIYLKMTTDKKKYFRKALKFPFINVCQIRCIRMYKQFCNHS